MTLHNCALRTRIVVPDPYSCIPGYRRNQAADWIYRDISHRASMSDKFIRSRIRPKTPCENESVIGARDDLFQAWMEDALGNLVLVSL